MRATTTTLPYVEQRFNELGIPKEEYSQYFRAMAVTDDIVITPCDWEGNPYKQKINNGRSTRKYFIYRHKIPFYNKEGKWQKYSTETGCKPRADFSGIHQYFSGVKKIDTIVITEGSFKAFTACKLGIPAVALHGIHNGVLVSRDQNNRAINYRLLPELKEFIRQFGVKKVVFLLDADAPNNWRKIDRAVSFSACIRNFYFASCNAGVECVYKHIRPGTGGKGLDDIITAKGYDERIRKDVFLNESTYYFSSFPINGSEDLKQIKRVIFGAPEGVTLKIKDTTSDQAKEIIRISREKKRLLVSAPTNSGKTYFAVRELPKSYERVFILVPLTGIADDIKRQYPEASIVMDKMTDREVESALHNKVIVSTYDSFYKIGEFLNDEDVLFCDEAHYPVENYDWKRAKTQDSGYGYFYFFDKLFTHKHVIAASATPPELLPLFGFYPIKLEAKKRNELQIIRKDYRGNALPHIKDFINTTDFTKGKVVIRANIGEERINSLCEEFSNSISTALIRSNRRNEPAYKQLKKTGRLPEVDVVFCTSFLDCGINILNSDIQYIANFDETNYASTSDIHQFGARFRKIELLTLYNYRKPELNKRIPFNQETNFAKLVEFAREECEVLNAEYSAHARRQELYKNKGESDIISSFSETGKFCRFHEHNGKFEVDRLAILNDIFHKYKQGQGIEEFYKELERQGHISIIHNRHCGTLEIEDFGLKEKERLTRKKRKQHQVKFLELLFKETSTVLEIIYHRCHIQKDLQRKIQQVQFVDGKMSMEAGYLYEEHKDLFNCPDILSTLGRVLKLGRFGFSINEAIPIVLSYWSSKKWGQLMEELSILLSIKLFKKGELSGPAMRDTRRILSIRDGLKKLQGKKSAGGLIQAYVNKHKHRACKLSQNKAVSLSKILFHCVVPKNRSFVDLKTVKDYDSTVLRIRGLQRANWKLIHKDFIENKSLICTSEIRLNKQEYPDIWD